MILFGGYMIDNIEAYSPETTEYLAQVSGNGNTILELQQTTPTPIPTHTQKNQATQKHPSSAPITETAISFSQPYISYGFLIPGDPIIRSDQIYTKTTHKFGASLYILQDGPLRAKDSSIPSTSCDSGGCSISQAAEWKSPLTFGAGIRCENSPLCVSDFDQENTYRPISEQYASPVAKVTAAAPKTTIVYKINIPASQPPLPYTNNISYIVIPNL
jgi:hypothetical protein